MKILCLYDAKAEKYATPFTSPNVAVATRDFFIACEDPKSPMSQYKDDIELCLIGEFDEITGIIKPIEVITTVATSKEFFASKGGKNANKG